MNFFDSSSDVQEVLKQSAVKSLQEVIQPLQTAIDFLRQEAPSRYLVPSIRHIVISDVTAAALFEGLWNLDRERAALLSKSIGENAGRRFADSLWDWLTFTGTVPAHEQALFELWVEIDSSANWGTLSFSISDNQFVVEVLDSFLSRSTEPATHEYCSFLEGYVFGFVWTSLKEMHQWLRGAGRDAPDSFISPPGVVRKCAGRRCSFELRTQADELSAAFAELMTARHLIRAEPQLVDAQVNPLRRSLEAAFKSRLGLVGSDRWEHGMRAARSVVTHGELANLIKRATSIHSELSGQVHDNPDATLTRDRVKYLSFEIGSILRHLECEPLGQEKRRRIQEEVARRQTGKASSPPEQE